MKNVTSRVLTAQTPIDELEVYLGTLGDSEQSEPGRIKYMGGRLVLEYTKKHKLKAIWVDDGYSDQMVDSLAAKVSEASSDIGREVARRYLHSHFKVGGYYRYNADFQILPAPPDAPQPEFEHADHAFTLEFSYSQSPNQYVSQHRLSKRFSELSLLLHALLYDVRLPSSYASHEWVVSGSPDWGSRYMQLGYFGGKDYPPTAADGFSSIEGMPPLEFEGASSYYAKLGIMAGEQLKIPDSLEESLRSYYQIDEDARAHFCRASYWTHVSSRIFCISQSAAFAALVSAIEVFLPDPSERCKKCGRPTSNDCCDVCNQPSAGPTRQFREFVKQFASGLPEANLNRLYSRRSSLSHGSTLIPGDLAEIGFRHNSIASEARNERWLLSQIVRVVLVNWLRWAVADSKQKDA